MSKNTILAFALILLTVLLFNSDFYYEKILRKPNPLKAQKTADTTAVADKGAPEAAARRDAVRRADTARALQVLVDNSAQRAAVQAEQPADTALDTVWIQTDKIYCGLVERGGAIVSLKPKEYRPVSTRKGEAADSLIELMPRVWSPTSVGLKVDNVVMDNLFFKFQGERRNLRVTGNDSVVIRMACTDLAGVSLEKVYVFYGNKYRIGLRVESPVLDGKSVTVGWRAGIRESEVTSDMASKQFDDRKVHTFDGREIEHIAVSKPGREDPRTGNYRWVGLTSKYFLIALVPVIWRDADVGIITHPDSLQYDGKRMNYAFEMKRTAEGSREEYWMYVGPTRMSDLEEPGIRLEKVLYGGWTWFLRADKWFPVICEYLLMLLLALQKMVGDYGLAILLITVFVKLLTHPLTVSSMRSMARMKDIQPKMMALRQRYKGNPQKMNQEIMAMYRKEGVNPMNPGGCLPMFLQMPVLFALYVVLRKAIELRGTSTVLVPWIHDLSQPEALPFITPMFQAAFPNGLWMYGTTVGLMPIIMGVLTFFQNKMTMKDPSQKFLVYFMPVFMLVMFNNFPSGLVIYWTFQSALGILQQWYINSTVSKKSAKPAKGGAQ